MPKKKLSSSSFSEGANLNLKVLNFHVFTPSSPTSSGLSSDSPDKFGLGLKNLFRFKKSVGRGSSYNKRRSTLGSICDVKPHNCYKISPFASNCEALKNEQQGFVDAVENKFFRSQSTKLSKASSLKLIHSVSVCDEKSLNRFKSLWKYKSRIGISKMVEGRRAKIIMPWGEAVLEILIEAKCQTSELLDTVASKCKLVERSYFGLAYKDEMTNHLNWLQSEKRVLEYNLPKRGGFIILHFAVRYFVGTFSQLHTTTAIELFYLQAKELIFKGGLESIDEDVFKLAALVLQETCGDFQDEDSTRKLITKYPLLPSFVLLKHPSISFCEKKIIHYYKSLCGNSRGLVIVGFLSIVENLPAYGIHYYYVKDKSGIPWWLGMNGRGISLYDANDKTKPRKLFEWESIENIFYRDKKFCLEVHNARRVVHKADTPNLYDDILKDPSNIPDNLSLSISDPTTQVSISKRTYGPSTVDVYHWFCASSQLTESVWSMAVSQHKFSLEMARRKSIELRSNEEIIDELNNYSPIFSDPDWTNHSQPISDLIVETNKILSSTGNNDAVEKAKTQLKVLKERKQSLEERLNKKNKELKRLCLDEANLTGELSKDYPQQPGEPTPYVKKRVGTSYSLRPDIINKSVLVPSEMSQLMLEYEIQDKITTAALSLAQEPSIARNIRKSRIESYTRELKKLKAMETNLKHMTKSKKAKDESSRRLKSMAEPSKFQPVIETQSRRSLEALSPQPTSHQAKTFSNTDTRRLQLTSHPAPLASTGPVVLPSNKSHKSAPSSPVLQNHPDYYCMRRFNSHQSRHKKHSGYSSDIPIDDTHTRLCSDSNQHKFFYEQRERGSPFLGEENPRQHRMHYEAVISGRNSMHHGYPISGSCHSTSYIIPLSADPRITSRNLAAGYGLLSCDAPMDGHHRNWHSNQGVSGRDASSLDHICARFYSQELPSRASQVVLDHNFSQMQILEEQYRCRSDSSSTLSSSSGGASGSTSSFNQLFSRTAAYPPPMQVASLQYSSGDFVGSSDSSMRSNETIPSLSSHDNSKSRSVTKEVYRHLGYHPPDNKWKSNEQGMQLMTRKSIDYTDERLTHLRDSGYDAASQVIRTSAPPSTSSLFSLPQVPYSLEIKFQKPFEMVDVSEKYTDARRIMMYQNLTQPKFQTRQNPLSSSSFVSNSSAGSLSSSSSIPYSPDNQFYAPNYPVGGINYTNKTYTLTKSNIEDHSNEIEAGSIHSERSSVGSRSSAMDASVSRSRRPILSSSDLPFELLDDEERNESWVVGDRTSSNQTCADREVNSSTKEVSFSSFQLEPKVSQEFEAEMLHWYEMSGISPHPDDQYTLV